jgi:multidrug resistance efflux pump
MGDQTKILRRVNPKTLTASLLGLCCALGTSALVARQQIAIGDGPKSLAATDFVGEIRPLSETLLTAPTPVLIRRTMVAVGDQVVPGQPLVEVDEGDARAALNGASLAREAAAARVRQARELVALLDASTGVLGRELDANGRLAVAQRQLEQVPVRQWKDSPERARAAYDQAVAHEQRSATLADFGVIARQVLEDDRTAVRIAKNDLENARQAAAAAERLAAVQQEQARLQIERTLLERRRQRAQALIDLENAEFELKRVDAERQAARRRLEDLVVRATTAGTVVELPVRAGDRLPVGSILVRLAALDRLVVQVDVGSNLVNAVRKGQPARVHLPPDGSSRLGQVRTVTPLPNGAGTHVIEIEFDNTDRALLVGQVAQIRFRS